ncbi:FAD-binding oxidoreductase [Bordetella genomosp. 9]|uniref:D-lactate dehydrogenase (cytochrome) n=1 Tax=Bordetella genomosp. 9 TaxID=1416803 RepID=A0A1W6YZ53_9BORD|nr:FAD-linked oxidase C-terminal domain-containing protein [Bordetella genomosp. 9]ARP86159.1 2-hydroxy-acid oxidase [Bordetella genomosp. 9]ARP90180.1 2-hydroxy-acid oxidase [Bordetella genomosp. 9]
MNDLTAPSALRRPLPEDCLAELRAVLGERLSTAQAVREHHGHDESPYPDVLPDAVAFAHTTEEVAAIARICNAHRVPIVAYGAGSSLEGHLLPVQGGITLDLSQMNAVLEVHAGDFTATVQAGVTRKQLNEYLRDTGLFFPVDPGADASLGGMAATRASGTNAVRYGTMRENVVSLTVVTADGRVVRTSRRAPKSSAGYDLTRIFVGSEGTLGIITEVTVKLYPQPEAISAAICNFASLGDAVDSVIEIIQAGVPVARVEFMDEHAVRAVNRYSKLELRETPLLLFEFHGSTAGVQEQAEVVQEIVRGHGGMDFEWANRPEDRNRLWAARHNAYFAGLQLRPGCRSSTTDVCVPISALADCVRETARDLAEAPFPTTIVGHVGDGNFHVLMLLDPDSTEEWEASERINHALVRRAIAADGTCTGEHGVGLHKMGFLLEEHGQDALDLMRSLKHAFDPNNILNPGKIIDW